MNRLVGSAYGLEKKENEVILVFDLGGGTLTFLCLRSVAALWKKATNGDTHLERRRHR